MLAALQVHDMVAAFSDLASFVEEPERGVIAALEGLGWKLVPIEAEAAAIPAQDSRLTRESLAAALHKAGIGCEWNPVGYATHDGDHSKDADAILAALPPEAAVQEPGEDEVLHGILGETAQRYEGTNWRETFKPIEGAAQPAPDLDAIRLLSEAEDLIAGYTPSGMVAAQDWLRRVDRLLQEQR